jgi:hypothetical protein
VVSAEYPHNGRRLDASGIPYAKVARFAAKFYEELFYREDLV